MKTTEISHYELERNKPMPSKIHSAIQANLIIELAAFRQKYRILSELSLELTGWESVPDIAIYPKMEIDTKNDQIAMTEAPLCAIEILSPSQSLTELLTKAGKYFLHGVKSCWIVLPGLDNIYVFSDQDNYQMFQNNQTLNDENLNISFSLNEVFK